MTLVSLQHILTKEFPVQFIFNLDNSNNQANRFQRFNMIINNPSRMSSVFNATTTTATNPSIFQPTTTRTMTEPIIRQNNITNINNNETNSNLSIINNLVLNNSNLSNALNDESNFSYQE